MVEFLKIISVTTIMSVISNIGGRKTDKYFILMVGASGAGMLIIQGCTGIANAIASNPLVIGVKTLIELLIGIGS